MARARTGTIEQLRSGRWTVRVTSTTGDRRTIATVDTEDEAQRLRAAAVEAMAGGGESRGPTLAEYGRRWLETRRAMRGYPTQLRVWAARIEHAPWFEREMRSIRRADIRAWVRDMPGAAATKQNALNLLRACMRDALEDGVLKTNHTLDLQVPRPAVTRDPWTWLRPDEVDALVRTATPEERDVILFAIGTGLRAGELGALEWCDVGESAITVRYGGPGRMATKSGKPRVVPLFGIARDAIARQRAKRTHDIVWPGPHGSVRKSGHMLGRFQPWHAEQKYDRFEILCHQAGLFDADVDRPLVWHSLRHTCASLLVSGAWGRAWTLRETQELLGHTAASTTERYAHLTGTLVQRAAEAHDEAIAGNRRQASDCAAIPSGKDQLPEVLTAVRSRDLAGDFGAVQSIADATRRTVAEGLPVAGDLARVLAMSVVGQGGRTTELAVAVLSGGPHAVSRALDLADHLDAELAGSQVPRAVTG